MAKFLSAMFLVIDMVLFLVFVAAIKGYNLRLF
jgi:hypothetical protein